jgi:hypothetical protein
MLFKQQTKKNIIYSPAESEGKNDLALEGRPGTLNSSSARSIHRKNMKLERVDCKKYNLLAI